MKIMYLNNDEFETTGHSYGLFLGREIFKKNDIELILIIKTDDDKNTTYEKKIVFQSSIDERNLEHIFKML